MKIAVTSTGPSRDDQVEARFGRCPYFLIIDPDTTEFIALENPNIALGGGAGIQSAQLMARHDVQIILTGNCGPNAFQTFSATGIRVIVGISGPVRQAVEQFKAGAFAESGQANVASHFGMGADNQSHQTITAQGEGGYSAGMGGGQAMGRGMGMGGGRGMGRGMGMGGGRGMGRGMGMGGGQSMAFTNVSGTQISQPSMIPKEELTTLKEQAHLLEKQLKDIQRRISQVQAGKGGGIAQIDARKCTGCGICVEICPAGAIVLNDIAIVDKKKCVGCGACVDNCPVGAIIMVS